MQKKRKRKMMSHHKKHYKKFLKPSHNVPSNFIDVNKFPENIAPVMEPVKLKKS